MRQPTIASTAGALGLLFVTAWAHADPSDVDSLIERGVELRESGKDDQALEEFSRAFQISHGPRAQAQIALAEQALGRWVQAEADLVAALAATGDTWVVRNRPALERSLATIREHLGDLELMGGASGAKILVNGMQVGTVPLTRPLRLEVGSATVEVRAPGYYAVVRRVTITPNGTSREAVEMRPEEARDATRDLPSTVAAPSVAASGTPVTSTPKAVSAGAPSHALRPVAWGTAGGAAAFLAAGFVGLGLHNSKASTYNESPGCPGTGSALAQPSACADLASASNTWKTVSIVGLVGGTALAATSVVLFVLDSRASRSEVAAAKASGPTGLSASCSASVRPEVLCRVQF